MRLRKFWRADDDLSHLPRTETDAAYVAEERASRLLEQTKKEGAEVSRIALRLRELRERNHFAEMIQHALTETKE